MAQEIDYDYEHDYEHEVKMGMLQETLSSNRGASRSGTGLIRMPIESVGIEKTSGWHSRPRL
ncbi:MAG: hypothetical protein V1736_01910 [Pseudomonadota bacterium]